MRRALLALAAAGLLVAPTALAGAQVDDGPEDRTGRWNGTTVYPGDGGRSVEGAISWRPSSFNLEPNSFRVDLTIASSEPTRDSCPEPHLGRASDTQTPYRVGGSDGVPASANGDGFEGRFSVPFTTPCNGTYEVAAIIRPDPGAGFTTVSATISVARPAAKPSSATATRAEDGTVELTWGEPDGGAPPDFAGYRVTRTDAETPLAQGSSSQTLTDEVELGPGESATYEIASLRDGPDGTVASDPITATVSGPEPEAPEGEQPGDGHEAAAGSGGGSGAGAPQVSRPATGSRRPSVPALPRTTVTTVDTGYDETLPFDRDLERGPADAVLPDDEMASLVFDEEAGAGLLVPGATAAVLVVWAMHLRYLNRLARQ